MSAPPAAPCPCENSGAHSSLGPVQDVEVVIRFVSRRDHLPLDSGKLRLTSSHFSSADIKGAREKDGRKKSVSSFRGNGLTSVSELVARACVRNRVDEWSEDPVIAIAQVCDLRQIRDTDGRREICVYADRTEKDDPLGVCESHASIRRSEPTDRDHNRQDIAILRSRLSDAFAEVRHLISGAAAIAPPGSHLPI
jgi:hypothetical protein